MSKILPAAVCSQMSNPKSGTGSGGDRCVEAVTAMINVTYKIGPRAKKGQSAQDSMIWFTEAWNRGADVSALESVQRIIDFVNETKQVSINSVSGEFANVQTITDRGHISYTTVADYRQLRLLDGSNPYQWNPATQPGPAGHCLLICGFGNGVVVHDPLRAEDGQPAEYSVSSFENAGWQVIGEVVGTRLDGPEATVGAAQTHIIRPGETFWGIASYYYGNGDLDYLLAQANPTMNAGMLHIGQTMVIPAKPAGV